MANEEQLSILKQGVEVWNEWRKKNPNIKIDLSEANLLGFDLTGVNFRYANLQSSSLIGSNLQLANLMSADLSTSGLMYTNFREAFCSKANFTAAHLNMANLFRADFSNANLSVANLDAANLLQATFYETNLEWASLIQANFNLATFYKTNFSNTILGLTIFGHNDLSSVIGLENATHVTASTLGYDTIKASKGIIPAAFLRGCGLSDWDIEELELSNPDLSNGEINKILHKIYDLRATQAVQIQPLFVSYSHADTKFVDKLENKLNSKGIRFWRDIHDMKAGRMETQIDQAINQNRTVLLVLSRNSIKSDWVEHEVRAARGLEKDMGRDVLCPVALDDSWKSSPWPKRIMEQIMEYNILDFSTWEDDNKFEGMFRKLIDGLELFYKDKSHGN